ncbi:hypothetical protein [Paenibacillus sp. NEAU-GSW1]|uniref:hypothetical protein n=1 Tax=Paenibacillus sp. NEAU-GSW1 TaxID=2682486 RepID=UPI00156369B7|nr:hypothetical protein [Paenibacillus sp. NEAU-GSW1]
MGGENRRKPETEWIPEQSAESGIIGAVNAPPAFPRYGNNEGFITASRSPIKDGGAIIAN